MPKRRPDDITRHLLERPGLDIAILEGVITSFDSSTNSNTVALAGGRTITDVPIVGNPSFLEDDTIVLVIRNGTRHYVLGQLNFEGTPPVQVPQRIATDEQTSDSVSFTTSQTQVQSVTASLVAGRTYRVRFWGNFVSTNSGDNGSVFVEEDSVGGDTVAITKITIGGTSGIGWTAVLEGEYTASSTGSKTFVASAERSGSGGTWHRQGSSANRSYMYVDYIGS